MIDDAWYPSDKFEDVFGVSMNVGAPFNMIPFRSTGIVVKGINLVIWVFDKLLHKM